jgi:hypothetical protein
MRRATKSQCLQNHGPCTAVVLPLIFSLNCRVLSLSLLQAMRQFMRDETGYQKIQGTKPQTLAYALTVRTSSSSSMQHKLYIEMRICVVRVYVCLMIFFGGFHACFHALASNIKLQHAAFDCTSPARMCASCVVLVGVLRRS